MARYRYLPQPVDAEQFHLGAGAEFGRAYDFGSWPPGVHGEVEAHTGRVYACLRTPQGCQELRDGDWVITDAWGNRNVCPRDLFRILYAPAEGR